ncbi:MAG: TRAP transporter substrate-binding protein DctP [Clostridiales bacterium]|nr:TRAP transporter substrate-binding protein DctP [Clostridiales bacterium]
MKFKMTGKAVSVALILALVCGAFAGCGGSGGGGSNDETIVLKLASDAPVDHIATRLNTAAADKVKERTNGRVTIDYYGASQLGSYESVYQEIVMGTVDIAQITVPDALDARLGSAYLPYYATSFDEAEVLYAPDSYMTKVFAELTAQNGVRFLGWVLEGFIGMGVVKDPTNVFEPGAPKGIKLRSPAMATFRKVQEDLGYNPITITYAEVPMAIQTKVVDGWIGGTPNMNYAWVGEIITKMYVNYLHAEATSYVMSEKSLAKLSPEDQQIVIDVFREQSVQSIKDARDNEEVYKKKLTDDYGVEVVEFTKEQLQKNADFVRDVTWTKLEEDLTPELIAGFRAEVAKLNK